MWLQEWLFEICSIFASYFIVDSFFQLSCSLFFGVGGCGDDSGEHVWLFGRELIDHWLAAHHGSKSALYMKLFNDIFMLARLDLMTFF